MLAALVVVILGALAGLTVSLLAEKEDPNAKPDGYFRCTECDHEWSISNREARRLSMQRKGARFDCPKCKAPNAGVPLATCPSPKCKHRYPNDPENPEAKCPECGIDIAEWYADHPAGG